MAITAKSGSALALGQRACKKRCGGGLNLWCLFQLCRLLLLLLHVSRKRWAFGVGAGLRQYRPGLGYDSLR